jgi:hypothetical protein
VGEDVEAHPEDHEGDEDHEGGPHVDGEGRQGGGVEGKGGLQGGAHEGGQGARQEEEGWRQAVFGPEHVVLLFREGPYLSSVPLPLKVLEAVASKIIGDEEDQPGVG